MARHAQHELLQVPAPAPAVPVPTLMPALEPIPTPTPMATQTPTSMPTLAPTPDTTLMPTFNSTFAPTPMSAPTPVLIPVPTLMPTSMPTSVDTLVPTPTPTKEEEPVVGVPPDDDDDGVDPAYVAIPVIVGLLVVLCVIGYLIYRRVYRHAGHLRFKDEDLVMDEARTGVAADSLPMGWTKHYEKGVPYYYNAERDESTWIPPTEPSGRRS